MEEVFAVHRKKFSVFQKALWGLLACILYAGSTFAAMDISDFLELCAEGSFEQIVEAIENGANVNEKDIYGWAPGAQHLLLSKEYFR